MTLSAPAPLSAEHKLDAFDCGQQSLNDWLIRRARNNQSSGASRTFVVCDGEKVVAYYSLASASIALVDATGSMRRNMPDPIPVVLLGRLAIHADYQGRGLGRALMKDAFKRVLSASQEIGIRGLVVHAISEDARAFYSKVGFDQSPTGEMTLMISVADLRHNL